MDYRVFNLKNGDQLHTIIDADGPEDAAKQSMARWGAYRDLGQRLAFVPEHGDMSIFEVAVPEPVKSLKRAV